MLTINDWGKMIGKKVRVYECKWYDPTKTLPHDTVLRGCYVGNKDVIVLCVNRADHPRGQDCKPILKTFDQMTEGECRYIAEKFLDYIENVEMVKGFVKTNFINGIFRDTNKNPWELVDYLDSIGIDQRGWIEKGLAIKEVSDG